MPIERPRNPDGAHSDLGRHRRHRHRHRRIISISLHSIDIYILLYIDMFDVFYRMWNGDGGQKKKNARVIMNDEPHPETPENEAIHHEGIREKSEEEPPSIKTRQVASKRR